MFGGVCVWLSLTWCCDCVDSAHAISSPLMLRSARAPSPSYVFKARKDEAELARIAKLKKREVAKLKIKEKEEAD